MVAKTVHVAVKQIVQKFFFHVMNAKSTHSREAVNTQT